MAKRRSQVSPFTIWTVGLNVLLMVQVQARKLLESAPLLIARLQETAAFRWAAESFGLDDVAMRAMRAAQTAGVGRVLAVAGKVAEGLAAAIAITSLSIFMLLFGGDLFQALLDWFEPGKRQRYHVLAARMRRRVGGYVSGTLIVSMIGGTVIGTTLAVLGNPYFLPLGLVMILLGVIPWAGSALGAVMLVSTSVTGILGALLALPVAGAVQVVLQDVLAERTARWRRLERGGADPRQLHLWEDRPDGRSDS